MRHLAGTKYTFYEAIAMVMVGISCAKEISQQEPGIPASIQELIAGYDDCTCDPYIDQYIWRSRRVYALTCRGAFCDCQVLYFNENGVEIKMAEGYFLETFRKESILVKNVWTCQT